MAVSSPLPQKVDDLTLVFPADVRTLMPKHKDIPDAYPGMAKWIKFQQDWFYGGLEDVKFTPKEGINPKDAWRHLKAIQGSFQPKHEHKEAAIAYLASLWFEDVKYTCKR